jgi:hypothetical protein
MIDIEEIETLARLATPGPWSVDSESVDKFDRLYVAKGIAGDLQGRILEVFANCLVTSDEERYVNAAFTAAANPATILALIAEVRALRDESARLNFMLENDAFTVQCNRDGSILQYQLMTQDEDENYHVLHDEHRFYNTERDAIDAARGEK